MTEAEKYIPSTMICPECKVQRGVGITRSMLRSDEPVRVYSAICDHSWNLTPEEKAAARKAILGE
jgi:hypothetical protein